MNDIRNLLLCSKRLYDHNTIELIQENERLRDQIINIKYNNLVNSVKIYNDFWILILNLYEYVKCGCNLCNRGIHSYWKTHNAYYVELFNEFSNNNRLRHFENKCLLNVVFNKLLDKYGIDKQINEQYSLLYLPIYTNNELNFCFNIIDKKKFLSMMNNINLKVKYDHNFYQIEYDYYIERVFNFFYIDENQKIIINDNNVLSSDLNELFLD
jgi:hypothetical protein